MRQSVETLNIFNTLVLKQTFKPKTFFKKFEYRFRVENIKIEKALSPFITAISESNIKTNRMVSTKWTKEQRTEFCW